MRTCMHAYIPFSLSICAHAHVYIHIYIKKYNIRLRFRQFYVQKYPGRTKDALCCKLYAAGFCSSLSTLTPLVILHTYTYINTYIDAWDVGASVLRVSSPLLNAHTQCFVVPATCMFVPTILCDETLDA
jgi:hypothetical protein